MKPELLYLSASVIPSASANSVHVMKMCDAFQRAGVRTTLLSRSGNVDNAGTEKHFYGTTTDFTLKSYPTINVRGISFLTSLLYSRDLIATSNDRTIYYGRDIPSLLLCTMLGKKVVYESHGLPEKTALKFMESALLKSRNLLGVVYISLALKALYDASPKLSVRDLVLHDSADFPPNWDDKTPLDGDEVFKAVYVGALFSGRGLDLIFSLAARLPDVGFHLFGGSKEDLDREKNNAKEKQLKNVYFYGYVYPRDTYKCRNSADVLLMPYKKSVMTINNASETSRYMSPLKLFEYMASKKPIISSDHDVLQEVLTDNKNALLCDPDDIDAWEEAIIKMKNSDDLCQRLAKQAFSDFEAQYTWDKRATSILSFCG